MTLTSLKSSHVDHAMSDTLASACRAGNWVIGNWKMSGSLEANSVLINRIKQLANNLPCHVSVCVPFPYLAQVQSLLAGSSIRWGAQDISCHEQGAYTGEVSARMLAEFGVSLVIVGHSERRSYHAESNQLVADKAKAALASGITPIVCLGETLTERQMGCTLTILGEQLAPILALGAELVKQCIFAYEPVWAIGTGLSATPEQAQQVHGFLRDQLASVVNEANTIPVLYGGSVKPTNAATLFLMDDINGALVGGASLIAEDFIGIATRFPEGT